LSINGKKLIEVIVAHHQALERPIVINGNKGTKSYNPFNYFTITDGTVI